MCARGWWLVTSVYLVVVADLPPAQLVLLGTGQALTVVVAEVPAGVLADTVSRKLALVVAHVVSGAGMVLTGLVTGFPALAVAQALWGLGWAFASGADVAWITDELGAGPAGSEGSPGTGPWIGRVLAARARWELTGAAAGLVAFGALAWATDLRTGVVVGGLAMTSLALVVALRFPEHRFVRPVAVEGRWRVALGILRRGVRLAGRDREITVVLVAWLLVNGAGEGYGRLVENRLVGLGFGGGAADPIVWFTALGITTLLLGALVLRAVEARVAGDDARRLYLACCAVGVVGLVVFAHAPDPAWAVAGTLLVSGVAHPGAVVRAVGEIWVNRRTTSDVRATVHSLLSQAEQVGEIAFGLLLAAVAGGGGATASLTASALVLALATLVVARGARPR